MDREARLDFLEGRVEEQSRNWERLFADIGRVDQRIDVMGSALSARIDIVSDTLSARIDTLSARIDNVSDTLSTRIDVLSGRIDRVDEKLDRRFDTLQQEISKQFRWTIGVMVTLTIGVITAVLTR